MIPFDIQGAARLALALLYFTIPASAHADQSTVKQSFGKMADGTNVDLYTLTNAQGMKVTITNYGATIVSLWVPDRHGKLAYVVLGFDTLDE